jgi:hypothetical protein
VGECVCVCVCVTPAGYFMYVCIYMYMYICTYIHIYVYTYIHVYIYICVYICMYVYIIYYIYRCGHFNGSWMQTSISTRTTYGTSLPHALRMCVSYGTFLPETLRMCGLIRYFQRLLDSRYHTFFFFVTLLSAPRRHTCGVTPPDTHDISRIFLRMP